jgi:thymidylate synthase (FAD)
MADLCIEIKTTRAISAQILRHRSFHFQEFSQRYSQIHDIERVHPRRQDPKNRQSSHDDLPEETLAWFERVQDEHFSSARALYDEALSKGIAKESARFLLPLASGTTLYMKGTVRDWVHYINLRSDQGAQAEHRQIALACKDIFCENLPALAQALGWRD